MTMMQVCVCVRVSCYNKQVVTGQLFIREMQGALGPTSKPEPTKTLEVGRENVPAS